MKSQIITLLLVFGLSLCALGQVNPPDTASTDPESATLLDVTNDLSYRDFLLHPEENISVDFPITRRAVYPQNYYFRTTMPAGDALAISGTFPTGVSMGMTAFYSNGTENIYIDHIESPGSPVELVLTPDEVDAGREIIIKLWFSEDMNGETISLAATTRPYSSPSKLINVSTSTYTAQELVEDILVTGCLEAFNVTYNGDPVSLGYFSGSMGSTDFDEGIVLTTGDASLSEGGNNSGSTGYNSTGGTDPDLQALIPGYSVNDAAILEFDFIPASDSLVFDFIFGSEEYPEWVGSDYNDVFGFFLSGPGIAGPYSNNAINVALIPGTTQPVTIDNVNDATNPAWYVDNSYGGDIEYDGATLPMRARADVQACETYHIKIAIGDAGDEAYDSGVFLNANSFKSGEDFVADQFNPWYQTDEVYEGCQTHAVFTRVDTSDTSEEIAIALDISGTATEGTDIEAAPDTVYISPGEISDTLILDSYTDGIAEGPEYFIFTYSNGCPCTPVVNHDTIWLYDEIDPQINMLNSGPICEGDSATLSFTYDPAVDSLIDWTWLVNGSHDSTITVAPTTTTTYTLEVDYPCTTEQYTTTLTVYPDVDATIDPVPDQCADNPPVSLTAADPGGTWAGTGVTGDQFDPATAGPGDHIVSYSLDNGNCSDTDSITIHVDDYLDPTIDSIEIQCRTDDAFLLTAATPGGTWTGPGVVGGQNLNPTNAGVGFHWIYYTLTNGGCTSVDSIEVEIVDDVDATIHDPGALCETEPAIDLEANWPVGIWSGPGIVDAAEGIFDPAVAGPGDHIIQFEVGSGGTCSDEDTIMIHVDAMPDASISATGPFCFPGDTVSLTANTPGGTWAGPAISDPVNGTFDPALTGSGSTQVTYTVGSGICYDADTVSINVNPAPTANVGADQTHCDYDVPVTIDA
ncbi:MAG: choice-of-anchor L domain-containing protein, partial [Bacteroidota bacterium]